MNVYDSQRMSDALAADGYAGTDRIEDADLVLLNTCHIREKAAEKVYSELGRIRDLKAERASRGLETMVGVAGCVAQAEGAEIIRRQSAVDLVIGPQTYHRLPEALRKGEERREGRRDRLRRRGQVRASAEAAPRRDHRAGRHRLPHGAGRLRQVLHLLRGALYARLGSVAPGCRRSSPRQRSSPQAGVREVTLLGQNVNAWHGEGPDGKEWGLGRLLFRLAEIPGIARLRYTTSHPRDMDDELIEAHRDLPALMPYLHLPVQSGSDRILKAMNRRHKAADYLKLIERIRAVRPDMAMSGDFIVGFPGETDADFEATLELVRDVRYAQAFSFKYSPRPGTPGAEMDNHVAEAVKDERLQLLQALLAGQQQDFTAAMAGRTITALVEKPGRQAGQRVGRSPWLQPVIVDETAGEIGDIINVRITRTGRNSLFAEPV